MPSLDLLLPGDPRTRTGGYLYDRRIVEGLEGLGWTTRVLSLQDDFPDASTASLRAAEDTLAAIPSERIVVVDGLALADLAASLERHAPRLRLVALVHHPVGDETGLDDEVAARLRRDERRAWQHARGVIVTSEWTRRRLIADGVRAERVRVVQPGSDPPDAAERAGARVPPDAARRNGTGDPPDAARRNGTGDSPDAARNGTGDPPDAAPRARSDPSTHVPRRGGGPRALDAPRLLCVATLTERKGHAVLLDALARIADRPWRLDCVGSAARDPATVASIRARIGRHDLAARVVLHGETSRSALDACYAGAHAFVLPSYLEGYGMAFADALAHGLPIVGTTAGAIPETVGDAGLLVPPGDVGALAAALARVLDDDALRAGLAARARARARALPTWADASARFAAALDALAGTVGSETG